MRRDYQGVWLPGLCGYLIGLVSALGLQEYPTWNAWVRGLGIALIFSLIATLLWFQWRLALRDESVDAKMPQEQPTAGREESGGRLRDGGDSRRQGHSTEPPEQARAGGRGAQERPKDEPDSRYSGNRGDDDYRTPHTAGSRGPTYDSPQPSAARHSTPSAGHDYGHRSAADRDRLIEVWEDYWRHGDGHFNAAGLRRHLRDAGLGGEVVSDQSFGDQVLAVKFDDSGTLYLLPNFAKPPRAVAEWFDAIGTSSRLARIGRLHEPAQVRRAPGGIEVVQKGMVE